MSAPKNLKDCYTHEMKDLWSANDQMEKALPKLMQGIEDDKLTKRLNKAVEGIRKHTETLKGLLDELGESDKEHCKGMEGLVKEATKHVAESGITDPDVKAVVLVSQYQRMCHYGICGFGTAKAFAEALGMDEHVRKLDQITADIYQADENMSDLAERSVNLKAKEAA